jgi:hypothetical protein
MAPKAAQAAIEAIARPPGTRPISFRAASYNSELMPAAKENVPISMKRGMTLNP